MKTISQAEYEELCQSGRPDDVKFGYPSMIYHPDDTISKIWANPLKTLSSARIKPYAKRFVENAAMIRSWGISTPEILDYFKIEKTNVHIVQYKILPGQSIRDIVEQNPEKLNIPDLAKFILSLHEKGIQFRTVHLGNIIQMKDNSYGLIDFCDVSHKGKPLSPKRRAINLTVPMKYKNDMALIKNANLPDLKNSYLKVWNPNQTDKKSFLKNFETRLKQFSD